MSGARRGVFNLARELGMTVKQLEETMTVGELVEWITFFAAANKPPEIDLANAGPETLGALFGD